MSLYALSMLMAVIWATVSGSFTVPNLIFGFVISLLTLYLLRERFVGRDYTSRFRRVLALVLLFLVELAKSAWRVATLVLQPKMDLKPGIFAFPLTVKSDWEISLLANLITLTPGTLSVDVSDDRTTLYIHAIDCSDVEVARRDIAEGFEKKIMEAFA